jgi:large subunit ribosomal protein L21
VYAVIEVKSRQMVVREGDVVRIPYHEDMEAGKTLKADRVLLIRTDKKAKIGTPEVSGASVSLEILGHGRDRKVTVVKKKRRKNYRRITGHRQQYTEAVVTEIEAA